jgi:hypothetical protein
MPSSKNRGIGRDALLPNPFKPDIDAFLSTPKACLAAGWAVLGFSDDWDYDQLAQWVQSMKLFFLHRIFTDMV